MAEQERKTWLRRRVEDGLRRGFHRAYETVKVDPNKFLLQVRAAYGLNFARERQMQAEFMYPAAGSGEVDVIAAYSSDGQIARS